MMTKTKSTKRALLLSALSLLMCVSMLIGSTFAWFTDSVTSAGNKIVAGTLDVQLLMDADVDGTYDDISDSTSPIFGAGSIAQNNNAETLWEPGKTQVAYLAIKNNGSLDLKYTVGLKVTNVSKDLYEVMEYAIVPDANKDNPVASWTSGYSVVVGTQSVSGDVSLTAGATHYFALAIHMDENAGNKYQGGEVNFDLTVLATQLASEFDSFDNQYDKDAKYPEVDTVTVSESGAEVELSAGNIKVTVPASAAEKDDVYKIVVSNEKTETDSATGETTFGFDLALYKNNVKVSGDTIYEVTLTVPSGAIISAVTHNGTALTNANTGADQTYTYDPATGVVTIYTRLFSPFAVTYTVPVDGITLDQTDLTIEMGKTATLTATVSPESATNKTVTWTSSDESVATVDENGVVTGVAPGTATITAAAGEFSASCTVTVFKEYVRKLNAGHNVNSDISVSTGADFLPIVAVNPTIYGYSVFDGDTRITNAVHFRFSDVAKQTIDENSYKVLVDLAVKDANGNDLGLKSGSPYNTGKEYLHVYMNLIEVPAGYSISTVKVNGSTFTLTNNASGNPSAGEYWIGYEAKDVYLQSMEAGLIEVTVTKTN